VLALGLIEQEAVARERNRHHTEVVGSSSAGVLLDPVAIDVVGDDARGRPVVPLDRRLGVREDRVKQRESGHQRMEIWRVVRTEKRQ